MPAIGTTAVVIELRAADVLLEAAGQVDPRLVRPGLPAHVTVLYPFVPAGELTDETDRSIRGLAGSIPAADVHLARIVTEPGFVSVHAAELEPAVNAFREHWPQLRPYGGRFGPAPAAHVTVAMGCDDSQAQRVGELVSGLLPLRARAEAVHVVALTERGWKRRLSAPFC
ncbi:2'-5' RNA ligase family protein [Streptomyces xanthophaeus]